MSQKGFVKATSNNFRTIDIFMVTDFMKRDDRFNVGEMRGTKAASAIRETYGDNAIGYVELKRDGLICVVQARICPEHKVRSKAYSVIVETNEEEERVSDLKCNDFAAAAGGCKHALAFLMWLYTRSEDSAPTEVTSYWQKPRMSGIGSSVKFVTVKVLGAATKATMDSQISKYNFETQLNEFESLSIHKLLHQFKNNGGITSRNFMQFSTHEMSHEKILHEIRAGTSSLWHELRYGRIPASKIYEAAHCQTVEGMLTDSIIGSRKVKQTKALARGINLEKSVIAAVE
ncbi:hypothetical protein NQ315_003594 [Exocentrus adspersus]|uniref:SWIM-type domain-containing protein n=1 Tax=Exocentrus adspersus TaxID=1586481 RepID=A0AAV8VJD7_9CUCU|nr:hypothetical protein NQ315_003594 [Exocentrus adspersus]